MYRSNSLPALYLGRAFISDFSESFGDFRHSEIQKIIFWNYFIGLEMLDPNRFRLEVHHLELRFVEIVVERNCPETIAHDENVLVGGGVGLGVSHLAHASILQS